MGEWHCFKCKEKMVEADITTTYLDITRFVSGIKCPKCKESYLTEKTVVEEVSKGEEELEAKLG